MLKGRGRDPRVSASQSPAHLGVRSPAQAHPGTRQPARSPTQLTIRTPTFPRAPLAKPEPDYEVVEFPSEQYVNAKLQPPPPPPPRPPTGHPAEAASCGLCGGGGARVRCTECGRRALCASCDDMYHRHPKRRHHQRQVTMMHQQAGHPAEAASCGLCGGGGARVRCTECGRRALCASCDDMYHRHPKRRHHQRQALSLNQIRDERPPLPPKGTPPVPPPRRHKMGGDRMSASPRPPSAEQRNSTPSSHPVMHTQTMPMNNRMVSQNSHQIPPHLQKLPVTSSAGHMGSMPYLNSTAHHGLPAQAQANTLGHMAPGWQRPRASLTGFNMPPNMPMAPETWEAPETMVSQSWGRPLRRGASVLELGGGMGGGMGVGGACGGCGQCAGGWRYGSCASLEHQAWAPGWPAPAPCCHPPMHPHGHMHAPYTPQPYRRADSRAVSRVASRAGSRAASPAVSTRSRASRRTKHRTPSPPPLPSSDADSESESDGDRPPPREQPSSHPSSNASKATPYKTIQYEEKASPVVTAPAAARAPWQCEHCTFVNEAGVRVCAVCCRTPTAAPREMPDAADSNNAANNVDSPSVADSVRIVAESARGIEHLDLNDHHDPPPPTRTQLNGDSTKATTKKERMSTGCGPSPPREDNIRKHNNRLVTPSREQSVESTRTRHDMAVGPSPPREVHIRTSATRSPPRQNTTVRVSPYREAAKPEAPTRHSISVGPSPPRENSIRPSPVLVQKKSAGTSPPREREIETRTSTLVRSNVSNTGTSPPPQSISTQTYEVPNAWERAPSAARSRRRVRGDGRRERSHSRHSLSSDTRESERSTRTSGGGGGGGSSGRWEWRESRDARDSSPGAEWSGSERRPPPRLARRASHLDLRRDKRPPARRSSFYRSEAASPEPTRAMSLEALATATGANAAAAERGLELARLMAEAERLGFSAAEVQAALAQSPAAPLAWLRERWPSLVSGVRAAAARLAPRARVPELEARAALARHRGAMWPAVTDCVERYRRQAEKESGTRQHGGRVWGSPAGADDDAAPPRGLRAEDSSDEFDGPPPNDFRDDDWMYLPLDVKPRRRRESVPMDEWDAPPPDMGYREVASDVALELSRLLAQAGVPARGDDLIIKDLLSNAPTFPLEEARNVANKPNSVDFIQSENDFIDAYNALTRSTPLPSVDDRPDSVQALSQIDPKRDMYDVNENISHSRIKNATINKINNNNNTLINTTEVLTDFHNNVEINVFQDNQSKANPRNDNLHQEEALLLSSNKKPSTQTEIKNPSISLTTDIHLSVDNHQTNKGFKHTVTEKFEESLTNESRVASYLKENLYANVENNFSMDQHVNQGHEKANSPVASRVKENANENVQNNSNIEQRVNKGLENIRSPVSTYVLEKVNANVENSSSMDQHVNQRHEETNSSVTSRTKENGSANVQNISNIDQHVNQGLEDIRSPVFTNVLEKVNANVENSSSMGQHVNQGHEKTNSPVISRVNENGCANVQNNSNIDQHVNQGLENIRSLVSTHVLEIVITNEENNSNIQNVNPRLEKTSSPVNSRIEEYENANFESNSSSDQNVNQKLEKTSSSVAPHIKENVKANVGNRSKIEQNENQGVEKTSNLNDIVGDTQRLIQQMKDEINSDISYIDSRNASQSEPDSSSNESDISSEHESSYSDTEEKETDDLSSDESESSSAGSEAEHLHERRPTIIHRTSSEENDQFEEAMDHIEDQMEDFKNTNIEILDSIARSLQEDHTMSEKINEPAIINDKREDLNNNLFVKVNSFDEIYAQLNTNKRDITNQGDIKSLQNHNNGSSKLEEVPKINTADFNVKAATSTKQTISMGNQNNNTLNEDLDKISHFAKNNAETFLANEPNRSNTVDNSNSSDEEGSLNSAESVTLNDHQGTNHTPYTNKPITENISEQILPLTDIMTQKITTRSNTENDIVQNITLDNKTEQYVEMEDFIEENIELKNNIGQLIEMEDIIQPNLTVEDSPDHYISIEDNIEPKMSMQANIIEQFIPIEEITSEESSDQKFITEAENIITLASELNTEQENATELNISVESENQEDISAEDVTQEISVMDDKPRLTTAIESVAEEIENNTVQGLSINDVVERDDATNKTEGKTVTERNIKQENIRTENGPGTTTKVTAENIPPAVIIANKERKKSPGKSPPQSPTEAGTNKAFQTNKSNIPKLIKVVQNNKQKVEKSPPKVVASKVPVRKASLKQYPAPTPPKSHFGNVQSGHVKQLQTRLFSNKFPKTVVNVPDVVDVKPSTSTMHKKKPAPPPPTTNQKQPPIAASKASPPKEKKNNFFRESCRTEDEWTESEAEDAPPPARKESQEPSRPPSPPPPVTVRRVSGQIIDLARVRLPEGSPERQARMLLAEGATETWEQARLAVELVARGTAPPAALLAALECADLPAALAYLHQDCELCAERLPEHEMVSMLRCTHRCCGECARLYFTVQITERSIADCVCPYCKEPDLESVPEDAWLEYFAHLDILLKTLLEPEVHELFQRKLRDRTLARDPNFRWCMECSSGFFVHPKQKKIRCPECRSISCAKCRKSWSANHEGLSCEQYAAWLDDNDPERSLAAVQQHLRDNGLECPRCRFKYSLSRGGCMHFTCTQCKYEFCYGCGKPFMMGARCGLSEYCARLGLHAHHPRNCLFYLRDKEPHELQTLLQMNNVPYETEAPAGSPNRCPIQLQRETPAGLVDGVCGSEVPPNYAGLCKNHYLEYLSRAVRLGGVDPLPLLDVDDLETLVRRAALRPPPRPYGSLDGLYRRALTEIVKEKIPLD